MTTKTKAKRAATPTELAEARAQEEARAHARPMCETWCGRMEACAGQSKFHTKGHCWCSRGCMVALRPLACRLARAEVERILACVPDDSAVILREIVTRSTKAPLDDEETGATLDLLNALAEGIA